MSRKDAKGCALFHTHPVCECLFVCICFFFASLRLCATSHCRILDQWLNTNSAEFISDHSTSSVALWRVAPSAENVAVAIFSSSSAGLRE